MLCHVIGHDITSVWLVLWQLCISRRPGSLLILRPGVYSVVVLVESPRPCPRLWVAIPWQQQAQAVPTTGGLTSYAGTTTTRHQLTVQKIHHTWSFGSDATVLDDYALIDDDDGVYSVVVLEESPWPRRYPRGLIFKSSSLSSSLSCKSLTTTLADALLSVLLHNSVLKSCAFGICSL